MTSNVKLLPLYAELQGHPKLEIIKHYARANVAHATDAKDAEIARLQSVYEAMTRQAQHHMEQQDKAEAEIEALRAELREMRRTMVGEFKRAERLAEALRELLIDMKQAQSNMKAATQRDPRWEGCAEAIQPRVAAAESALRDHDQEDKNDGQG